MPWLISSIAVAVVIIILFVMLRKRSHHAAGKKLIQDLIGESPSARPRTGNPALRQNLRLKYAHQEEKIDAAIASEGQRNPTGTVDDWMMAAIERWERDNR